LVRCMPACCSNPSSSGSSISTTSTSQIETAAAGRPVGYFTPQPTTPLGVRSTSSSAAPAAASYAHLGQERINADGSLSTVYTRYRQQQQQEQQQLQQAPHSASTSGSSPASNQQVSTATGSSSSPSSSAAGQQAPRPPGLPAAAPAAVPASRQQLDQLADLIQSSRRVVVITGAGCSTESNIPDYRGPGGAYTTGKCLCRRCCWYAVACCGCDVAGAPHSHLTWLPTKHVVRPGMALVFASGRAPPLTWLTIGAFEHNSF
jgi:hypothetical protein